MIVYAITNKVNGKQYVGQTLQTLTDRWKSHCSKSNGCLAIISAILLYGKENFTVETLFVASSIRELNIKEIEFINKFNTLAPKGYNLKTGGSRPKYSKISRQKMSLSKKGTVPWNKGLTKEDPRVASYIRSGENHHYWGKSSSRKNIRCSEETRLKISNTKRKKLLSFGIEK